MSNRIRHGREAKNGAPISGAPFSSAHIFLVDVSGRLVRQLHQIKVSSVVSIPIQLRSVRDNLDDVGSTNRGCGRADVQSVSSHAKHDGRLH